MSAWKSLPYIIVYWQRSRVLWPIVFVYRVRLLVCASWRPFFVLLIICERHFWPGHSLFIRYVYSNLFRLQQLAHDRRLLSSSTSRSVLSAWKRSKLCDRTYLYKSCIIQVSSVLESDWRALYSARRHGPYTHFDQITSRFLR